MKNWFISEQYAKLNEDINKLNNIQFSLAEIIGELFLIAQDHDLKLHDVKIDKNYLVIKYESKLRPSTQTDFVIHTSKLPIRAIGDKIQLTKRESLKRRIEGKAIVVGGGGLMISDELQRKLRNEKGKKVTVIIETFDFVE